MKPTTLSEVKSHEQFLEYLVRNFYDILGEGPKKEQDYLHREKVSNCCVITVDYKWGNIIVEESIKSHVTKWTTTIDCYKQKLAQLRNKPKFEGHPNAKCFVQDSKGYWLKNTQTCNVEPAGEGWDTVNSTNGYSWVFIQKGEVIGDWKQTFEKAHEKQVTPNVTIINDTLKTPIVNVNIKEDLAIIPEGKLIPIEMCWVTKSFIEQKDKDIAELLLEVAASKEINNKQTALLDQYISDNIKLGVKVDQLQKLNKDYAKLVENILMRRLAFATNYSNTNINE